MQNRNYVNVFTLNYSAYNIQYSLIHERGTAILFTFLYKVQCTNCSSYFEVWVYSMLPTVKKGRFLKCIRNM
jgi:hypothetical protein